MKNPAVCFNTRVKIKRARYFFLLNKAKSFGKSAMDIIGRHSHVYIL
jgi:hypothetical protein